MASRCMLLCMLVLNTVECQPEGIKTVAGSRVDQSPAGYAPSGKIHVTTREVLADITFPPGLGVSLAKARMSLLFDPSTGYYFNFLDWRNDKYPEPSRWIQQMLSSRSRVWATADRLLFITSAGDAISIIESTEKASSIDDAEAKALKWHSDRLSQVATRSNKPGYTTGSFKLGLFGFPKDFWGGVAYDSPFLPLKILDMTRAVVPPEEEHFRLLVESDIGKRAVVNLVRLAGRWCLGTIETAK